MSRLVARQVHRAAWPQYPTKLAVQADRGLLRRHIPPAWRARREIAGALGALLAANAGGCTGNPGTNGGTSAGPTEKNTAGAAIVAPLFEHGDGSAEGLWAMACIAVAAPAYLPEEEAIRVIAAELRGAGLSVSPDGVTLPDVIIRGAELRNGYEWVSNQPGPGLEERTGALQADLFDAQHHIAIEYVAVTDFFRLGGNAGEWQSSRELKAVVKSVNQRVHESGHGIYFGAFYDPVVYYSYLGGTWGNGESSDRQRWASSEEAALTEAKRLLQLQVKDFIEWLKAQGVI